ncbi:uncharacterized protein LOC142575885 [Dermacentor variabilis]|uniref:uncharacterized protein LOC142575885 n=1 Tax=Dermacentor variabilis TaxID=34621 RepID=UPI003F5C31E4
MAPTSAAVSVATAAASSPRGIMCRRLATLLFTLSLLAMLACAPSDAAAAAYPQHEDSHQTQASKFMRWSRATNTRERLTAALSGDQPVFLEADVVLDGTIPVLEPPRGRLWDVTLNELLYQATEKPKRVTLKLNMRSTEVLPQAFGVLMVALTENLLDLWIHADVLAGSAGKPPVEANSFMRQSSPFHPFAIISLGWNTKSKGAYSWGQVESMARLVSCGHPYLTRVAFKVRSSMVEASLAQLSWLLDVMPNATLVVWSADGEAPNASVLHTLRKARPSARIVYDLPQEHQLENLLEEAAPQEGVEGAKQESLDIGWNVEESNTGSCRKASLLGRNAVVLGDNGVSMVFPDSWANFEAKLDLTKPRSLAVRIGDEKIDLEGSCFQLVLNRSGQEVTSRAWPTTCKNHGSSSSSSKKPTAPAMVKQWTYGEPAALKLQPSPGAVVYAVRLQDPPEEPAAAASALVPTLLLLFFGILAVKVPEL